MSPRRPNYALLTVQEHLGTNEDRLNVPWAEFVGNHSSEQTFTISGDDPTDGYLELQVYDVGEWNHTITINGSELTGFDMPESTGWCYWMDSITGASLQTGENTLQIHRSTDTLDSFVVGTVVVNWKER